MAASGTVHPSHGLSFVCPHRKTILNSPNRSLDPTASHFLIKVRGETGLERRGWGVDVSLYCTVWGRMCSGFSFAWVLFCTVYVQQKLSRQPGYTRVIQRNLREHKCSCSQTQMKHTDTNIQSQTLQGMHRSTSHKPYHDVRRQLCTQSSLFSALPRGHVGRQNPQQCIKEQLNNWRLSYIELIPSFGFVSGL